MRKCILASLLFLAAGCSAVQSTNNSQPGWRIKTDKVDLFITANGGHMAPVYFCTDTATPIQPYYISPWQNQRPRELPDPVLVPLGAVRIPDGFGNVKTVEFTPHTATFISTTGKKVVVRVDHEFLKKGKL